MSAGKYNFSVSRWSRSISSRPLRLLLSIALCLLLIIPLFQLIPKSRPTYARLHLLIPATSTNSDLCKLLLSGQILGYPTPVLINHGATEADDAYVQHLAKIEGLLNYLDHLETTSEYAEDLALIIDGYDVWFQLPPETLLRRYYALNAAANARLVETYGQQAVQHDDMRQTIIFGPDKICWPIDMSRPACWAVPETTLSPHAFGPEGANVRASHNQPRWLNSGTVIGPIQDLKKLFNATLDEIHANHTTDSDQFYLSQVFGRQEYARLMHRPDLLETKKIPTASEEFQRQNKEVDIRRFEPNITDIKTEYHIGIDYESSLFQTMAFWKQFLTWMRPIDSWPASKASSTPNSSPVGHYQLQLPADVTQNLQQFSPQRQSTNSKTTAKSFWNEAEFLYNTVTKQIPALVHFTGEKEFRHWWWRKNWFQSSAQQLRLANVKSRQPYGPIGGFMWHNAEPEDAGDVKLHGLGGAWSDRGGWFSWKSLCLPFEGDLFSEESRDRYFHAHLRPIVDG